VLEALRRLVRGLPEAEPPAPTSPPTTGPDEVRLAAAALLVDLAQADGEFSPSERDYIESALGRHFGLDAATAAELIALARDATHRSVDHYQFTRVLTENWDLGQKMLLAEIMWGVILADGTVGKHESYLVRKLGNLLALEPAYLAQARRNVGSRESGDGD
jgi:uncharacterized tellurite resistance protein B-like protein